MTIRSLWPLVCVLALDAADAQTSPGEREMPSGVAGIRMFVSKGAAGDPAGLIETARSALAEQQGQSLAKAPVKTVPTQGFVTAIGSDRYAGVPTLVHVWMAEGRGGLICHVFATNSPGATEAVRPVLQKCGELLMASANNPGAGATPIAPASEPVAPPVAGGAAPASLKAALDEVPKANRPLAMLLRSGMSFSGGFVMPTYLPWMLFANGWAAKCTDWDPARTAPDPAILKQRPYQCDMDRWRRGPAGYEFQDDKGLWKAVDSSPMSQFRPGQHIAVDLVNTSGGGTAPGAPGLAVNVVSSGQLRMTEGGTVGIGSWTGVVVSGAGIGGGSSGHRGPVTGTYYADGHMIAIGDGQGHITRGFIGYAIENGATYVYLNGTQYWPKDRK